MAKRANQNAGAGNAPLDEAALAGMTREQLCEIARTYDFAVEEGTSNEDIVKAILKAQATGDDPAAVESQDNGGDKPPAAPPKTTPPAKEGSGAKKRLKCVALKGANLSVGDTVVKVGDDGIFEVEEKEAARLLTIPGYEEA